VADMDIQWEWPLYTSTLTTSISLLASTSINASPTTIPLRFLGFNAHILRLHLIPSSLSADVLLLALSKDPSDEHSHCLIWLFFCPKPVQLCSEAIAMRCS
ncbi:hypothetical protein L9F63_019524, partial [Diploptera punctata]